MAEPVAAQKDTDAAPAVAAGWRRDSDAMSAAMAEFEAAFGELNGAFVEQGSREMR